jgi:phage terminase Nu1 subunit (DNA packaging protein)
MAEFVTQKGLAWILGVSPRQIRNLEKHGLPSQRSARSVRYPIPDALEWYYKRKFGVDEVEDPKVRHFELKNQLLQIEVARTREALVPLELHRKVVGQLAERLVSTLRNLPSTWAPQLVAMKNEREVAKVLVQVADEMIEDLASVVDDLADQE